MQNHAVLNIGCHTSNKASKFSTGSTHCELLNQRTYYTYMYMYIKVLNELSIHRAYYRHYMDFGERA